MKFNQKLREQPGGEVAHPIRKGFLGDEISAEKIHRDNLRLRLFSKFLIGPNMCL